MYKYLNDFNRKEKLFANYTTIEMWNDPYISKQMLKFHLDPEGALASRKAGFMDTSIKWIIDKFKIKNDFKVCDFGCGPGLYSNRLAKTGAEVTGIDASTNSINYAKSVSQKENLNVKYINQNYLEFETEEKYDLIIMIFCDFCVLNPDQKKKLLSIFYNSLKPGGKILLDVHSESFFKNIPNETTYEFNPEGGFWSPDPYHLFYKTFKYDEEKAVLLKYAVIEENNSRVFYNYLKTYDKENLSSELSESGFNNFEFYSNVKGELNFSESDTICLIADKL